MRFTFSARQIDRIVITTPYIVYTCQGSEVVIETPSDGWHVRQPMPGSHSVVIKPPDNNASGGIQIGSGDVTHDCVVKMSYGDQVVYCLPPVKIYNPEGHRLTIGIR